MKPWITEAIGTQKVVLPSSVDQAVRATGVKLAMPFRSSSGSRRPFLNSSREASNGRQVTRSPAVPASSLELSAALYSVGAIGLNCTLMLGWLFSNTGRIWSRQIARSSLRQLSMVSVTGEAARAFAAARAARAGTKARRDRLDVF